jgi:hypothetical protein
MGMLDLSLQFSNAQAVTASAQSTFFYDQLTGQQLTTTYTPTPAAIFSSTQTFFGEDLGIGKGPGTPRVVCNVIQAFNTLTTMTIQFQGAPENATSHASGNRSDLVFVTYIQSDTIALALLTANTRVFAFDWPMRKVNANWAGLPRFVQLNYVVAGSSATLGTITSDVTLGDDDAQTTLPQYGRNYAVAA